MSNGGIIPEWTLGDRLRKARQVAGMSQRELAEAIGEGSSSLAMWESDRATPRDLRRRLANIARVTGVNVEWLAGDAEEDPPSLDTAQLYVLLGRQLELV